MWIPDSPSGNPHLLTLSVRICSLSCFRFRLRFADSKPLRGPFPPATGFFDFDLIFNPIAIAGLDSESGF